MKTPSNTIIEKLSSLASEIDSMEPGTENIVI